MNVSTAKAVDTQVPIWGWVGDRPITSMAQTRNFAGDFFEQATASITGARRLKTDSTKDVCPDLKWRPNERIYFESKSVGNNGSAILYDHRRAKDQQFEQSNRARLHYCFWRHHMGIHGVKTLHEFRIGLCDSISDLVIMPVSVLADLVRDKPVRVLNTKTKTDDGGRLGYGTNGYGNGWSIPYTDLRKRCIFQFNSSMFWPTVYGCQLPRFQVWLYSRHYTHFFE